MLENIFADLYNEGVLLFLDTDTYFKNTIDINILNNRDKFITNYYGGEKYTLVNLKKTRLSALKETALMLSLNPNLKKDELISSILKRTNFKGYVYTHSDPENILDQLENDGCAIIKYGFDSDSDQKADEVGKIFLDILNRYTYTIQDVDTVLRSRIITLVVDYFDVPQYNGLMEVYHS